MAALVAAMTLVASIRLRCLRSKPISLPVELLVMVLPLRIVWIFPVSVLVFHLFHRLIVPFLAKASRNFLIHFTVSLLVSWLVP